MKAAMMSAVAIGSMMIAGAATAETITFESDSDIKIIRGIDPGMGFVQFDLIGSKDGTILCLALDKDGEPLATSSTFAEIGYVAFLELELEQVDRVACRYN